MTVDLLKQLAAPFPVDAVSWRVGTTTKDKTKGMALAYIDARDVMDRLDQVAGADWQDKYEAMPDGSYCCSIGVKIGGEWRWRSDGALMLTESDKIDAKEMAQKGSYSDAFKRAAVKWGIGRYLYNLDSPWVKIEPRGNSYVIADEGRTTLRSVLMKQAKGVAPAPTAQPQAPKEVTTGPAKSTEDNAPVKAPASVPAGSPRKTTADIPTVAPGGSRATDWKAAEREKLAKREANDKRSQEIKNNGSAEVRGNLKVHLDKIKSDDKDARKRLKEWLSLAGAAKARMTQEDQLGITGEYNLKVALVGTAERQRLEVNPPRTYDEDDLRDAAE